MLHNRGYIDRLTKSTIGQKKTGEHTTNLGVGLKSGCSYGDDSVNLHVHGDEKLTRHRTPGEKAGGGDREELGKKKTVTQLKKSCGFSTCELLN